jgi:hypothetical protein
MGIQRQEVRRLVHSKCSHLLIDLQIRDNKKGHTSDLIDVDE